MDVVISGGRGTGKTTELIRYAADQQLTIITANLGCSRAVLGTAARAGIKIPLPVTWEALRSYTRDRHITGLAIDDLDLCIQQWARIPVRAATLNVTAPR